MKKTLTKILVAVVSILFVAGMAFAQGTCEEQAVAKKLAGAAKTSFMKKCEADSKATGAQASCEAQAKEKKLAGAAKNSFVKKCVKDSAK